MFLSLLFHYSSPRSEPSDKKGELRFQIPFFSEPLFHPEACCKFAANSSFFSPLLSPPLKPSIRKNGARSEKTGPGPSLRLYCLAQPASCPFRKITQFKTASESGRRLRNSGIPDSLAVFDKIASPKSETGKNIEKRKISNSGNGFKKLVNDLADLADPNFSLPVRRHDRNGIRIGIKTEAGGVFNT